MLEAMEPYIKYAARVGGLFAKIFAVLLTIYGIKEIWFRIESQRLSTLFKTNLTILYIAHMASVSLAISVLFGYTLVSLPVASAIVSATALIKNVFDLIKDSVQLYKLRKELESQQRQLAKQHEIFNNHLDAFNKQNQSYLISAYEFIGGKFLSLISFCKKMSFTSTNMPQSLASMNALSAELSTYRESSPKDVDLLAKDLENIIITSKKIIDLQNDILLMNYDINNKRYIIQFSGVTASLTLLLCFPFNWFALPYLNPSMLIIGIGSALTSMWGIYQKHLVEDKFFAVKNKQIHQLIEDSVSSVDKLNEEQARNALNEKLDSIVEHLDKLKPSRGRVIPDIFRANIPKPYQGVSEPPLANYIKEKRVQSEITQRQKSWWQYLRNHSA